MNTGRIVPTRKSVWRVDLSRTSLPRKLAWRLAALWYLLTVSTLYSERKFIQLDPPEHNQRRHAEEQVGRQLCPENIDHLRHITRDSEGYEYEVQSANCSMVSNSVSWGT